MDPIALAILQNEGTLTFAEKCILIIEKIREEERENDERAASRDCEQSQQAYKESA